MGRRTLLAGLSVVALLGGQQQPPVFRAGTRLVEVSVTVLDKKGNAVAGLAPSDFTVLDEGKPRPVAFFRFEGLSETAVEKPRPAPGVFTNKVELAGGPPRNVTALVLDALNTPPQDSAVARAQMMRYLKALTPETRVAIFHMGRQLSVLHDFTDDAASLRARLEKAVIGMPLEGISDFTQSVIEAEQFVNLFADDPAMQKVIEDMMRINLEMEMLANAAARRSRMERSLAAMDSLGLHLAGIPGRKNLVWISAGFSMASVTGAMGMGPRGGVENYESMVQKTSRRLAQHGVTLYIVDSKGVAAPPETAAAFRSPPPVRGRGRFEPQMDAERISGDPHAAMNLMASITGGRYLYNTNDLAAGFKQAVADLHGSYTLGFYASEEPNDRWHKLKVRVNRSGANVRHRQGYLAYSAPPAPVEWSEETWRGVISNPLGSSVIPLTAKCETTPASELTLALTIDADSLDFRSAGENLTADLEVVFADRTLAGSTRSHSGKLVATVLASKWQEVRAQGVRTSRQWKPASDVNSVRVVVRDMHTGQYGTVDVSLKELSAGNTLGALYD
jgi:VWFA-related protein